MEMVLAEAAVSFAVEKLGEALISKVAFLQGVEEQVNLLKDELKTMCGFLQDATQKQAPNNGIREWISQIRQVAHDVEDVIETFTLKIDTPKKSRGKLGRCACFPCHVNHLNKLGKEIESIRARLRNIDESRTRLDIQHLREGPETRRLNNVQQLRRLLPQQTDKHVVGLDKYMESLLGEAILNDRPGLSIARITGIGGLGKSTLAREVYNHSDVVAHFEPRAWVVASDDFDSEGVMRMLLRQLGVSKDDTEKLSFQELKGKLLEQLRGKQYFIVVDDVWEQLHWDILVEAFPDEQEKASRLLVTSRKQNLPNTARFASELKPLDPDNSWQLFLKKSFIDEPNGRCGCPQDLEGIGRKIVEKCGGLPLAITVLGGLLLEKRQSPIEWEKILKGLDYYLSRIDDRVSAVLELSYHNLPPHLKPCFLCLGFFREDATIRAEKLVQVWIAEGLISQEGNERTMEEIASGYLDELINQNIVQVKNMTNDGDRIKTCQIHDLIRDLSINKAKEEIGFATLKEGIHSPSSEKSRHHAIYWSTDEFTSLVCPNYKYIRSVFFHGVGKTTRNPSFNWKKFRLLRILDFEGFWLGNLPDAIGTLIRLRYLGLRDNSLEELPTSLGCLVNLQVLDIRENLDMKVPDILWKLESLRHLYMGDLNLDVPLRLDTLKNLQTLVCPNRGGRWMWPKHISEMTNLRRLKVNISEEEVSEFISSLAKLKNLSHLSLRESNINQDLIRVLEKLPSLLYLNLEDGAYVGREMVISDEGFPRLRVLRISNLEELREIELVGEGRGMPQLKRFEIYSCDEIESLPEHLTSVQELEIYRCPKIESLVEQRNQSQKS